MDLPFPSLIIVVLENRDPLSDEGHFYPFPHPCPGFFMHCN